MLYQQFTNSESNQSLCGSEGESEDTIQSFEISQFEVKFFL